MKFLNITFLKMICFFASLASIISCATISGRTQIVSIDSAPRGAKVYRLDSSEPIGTTPFFYRIPRAHSNEVKIEFTPTIMGKDSTTQGQQGSNRTISQIVDFDCRFRWLPSGFGNLIFINPIAYVAGVGVDLISGAAFDCGQGVLSEYPAVAPQTVSQNFCKKYLLAPPEHFDEEFSDKMAKLWLKHAQKAVTGCDSFFPYEAGKVDLEYININHHTFNQVAKTEREPLLEIARKHNITHFIVLSHKTTGTDLEVTPTVIDLHTLQNDQSVQFQKYTIANAGYRRTAAEQAIKYSVSLFPNSVTFGNTTNDNRLSENFGWTIIKRNSTSVIPMYVSKFGLTSIENSAGYANWEFESSFYPSFAFTSEAYDLEVKPNGTENITTKKLFYIHANPLYNYALSWHTPVGAFILHLGLGVSAFGATLSKHADVGSVGIASTSGFSWRVFLTDALFFQTGSYYIESGNHYYEVGPVKIESNRSSSYFQLGYFIPEMRRKFKTVTGLNY